MPSSGGIGSRLHAAIQRFSENSALASSGGSISAQPRIATSNANATLSSGPATLIAARCDSCGPYLNAPILCCGISLTIVPEPARNLIVPFVKKQIMSPKSIIGQLVCCSTLYPR